MARGHKSQIERAPSGQMWDNLRIIRGRIIIDYNTLNDNFVKKHESTVILRVKDPFFFFFFWPHCVACRILVP